MNFQSKGSKNITMYLGRFWRINKVENCVEMIGTLRQQSVYFVTFISRATDSRFTSVFLRKCPSRAIGNTADM